MLALTFAADAISRPGQDSPVLLRLGPAPDADLVVLGADGAVLGDADGHRRRIRGDRMVVTGSRGPWRLETPTGAVLAVSP